MLLATSDSDAAKNPRLRLIIRRSASVRPSRDRHRAMSACIETSVGIQVFLHAARYRSQAHAYLSGSSWLTSARQLIIALSSARTRPPVRSMAPSPAAAASAAAGAGPGLCPSKNEELIDRP